jgi:tripartite-type tricarboxylate transporter receptor subunit TctC
MKSTKLEIFETLGMLLALFMLFALSSGVVMADSYPNKPVRLIVPFPPGGTTDGVGRLLASKLSERLGKQVIVDNRGGGGTTIGTAAVAQANPDGYTLLLSSSSLTTTNALQKLPYDPMKSLVPVARLLTGETVLVAHPSVPAKSVKELITLAKQTPGKLIFASPGVGSTNHMAIELFKIMANIDFLIAQFKGAAPAMTDLLGGHSHALICSLGAAVPHIHAGKFRALGTGGAKRSVMLPDVPTIAEAGLPGYQAVVWWGIHVPAGTPAPIIDRLTNEFKVIAAMDEIKKQALNEGADVDYMGPTEFAKFIEGEMIQWARTVKEANIKVGW